MFVCEEVLMILYTKTLCLAALVALAQNVCSAIGTTPPNTTQPYRFPCGMDRCPINGWYCDKGRSIDSKQWTCSPCTEIEQWCEKDIARVPRDCLGYCEARICSASMKSLESKYREACQARGGLGKFLANNSIVVVCVVTLQVIIIIGFFAYTLQQCRLRKMRGSVDEDMEMRAQLMGNKPDSHDPRPTVQSTKFTQTDSTGLLGSANIHKIPVEFVQPKTKGAHGIRVLPFSTVVVDNSGKDCTEDTSFLDSHHQPNQV
ncbi:uncharacterized protein [Haliotis cracherodii]|uniref:uncharacterized protein isoform X1 n=2 Tax=Haliotis cracherodii TaxID=6455 RepID=UPI0039ECA6B8